MYKSKPIKRSLSCDQSGLAALEFALMAPIMMMLLLASFEVTRYILIAQKTEKAAVTVSDLVAQSKDLSTANLDVMILAVEEVMKPFDFDADGYVIISSVSRVGSGSATVNWQYAGSHSWTQSSQLGSAGNTAILPTGFTLEPNEGVIIAEVYYNFRPILTSAGVVPSSKALYKIGVYKPRLGELTALGS